MIELAWQMRQLLIPFALDSSASVSARLELPATPPIRVQGVPNPCSSGMAPFARYTSRTGRGSEGTARASSIASPSTIFALLLMDQAMAAKPRFPLIEPCVDCRPRVERRRRTAFGPYQS